MDWNWLITQGAEQAPNFATFVALLINFKQEKKEQKRQSLEDFLDWLTENHLEEMRNWVEQSKELREGIKQLLSTNHTEVMERFNQLDEMLATLASKVEGFDQIAASLRPNEQLSQQQLNILKWLAENDSVSVFMYKGRPQTDWVEGQCPELPEWKHLQEDFDLLVYLNLLRREYDDSYYYFITRQGKQYLNLIGIAFAENPEEDD